VNDKLSQRERTLYALQTTHSMVTEAINAVQNDHLIGHELKSCLMH
jgi:hypothetical protein